MEQARVLVVAVSDPSATRRVVATARLLNAKPRIIVRTRFLGEVQELLDLGASDVVPEEFETSIEIFTRVLVDYLVPNQMIERFIMEARGANYRMLRTPDIPLDGQKLLTPHLSGMDLAVFQVEDGAPLALAAQETVIVLSGNSASITEAYALIKKVSHAFARRHFRILVNKVKSEVDARSIFDNIAQVAAQRRIARLEYVGAIPLDDALRQTAQLCRPVVVQAPEALSAQACRDIAADMLYWPRAENESGGVESFVQQLLHLSQRIPTTLSRA